MPVDTKPVDCLIIGNGALGLFLANELCERGYGNIAVCGNPTRETGASQAAGAMLGCFAEVTAESLRSATGRQKFELGLEARSRWPAVLDGLREDSIRLGRPLHTVPDTYVVLNCCGAALDSANFDAILAAADDYAEPWEDVAPDSIPGYNPSPEARALRAIHLANEGAVDARAVLALLEERIKACHVALLAEAESLITSGAAVVGATLADGTTVSAGSVVLAAGAKSADLLESVIDPDELMPIFSGLGFSLVAGRNRGRGFDSVVRTPNRAFACGLHLVPLGQGREYLGATNMLVRKPATNAVLGDIHFLTDCAMRQLDQEIYHHEVAEYRVGNRPVPLDGFPLIGWTRRAGLYLLTGTYRDGFHNAPLLAEHAAEQLAGHQGTIGDLFQPSRAPIVTRSVEQAIEDFVQHRMAAWFEAAGRTPPNMTASALSYILREQATAFYDGLGLDIGLGPDVLMYVLGSLRTTHTAQVLHYLRNVPVAPTVTV